MRHDRRINRGTSFNLRVLMWRKGDIPHPHATIDTGGRTNGEILRRLKQIALRPDTNENTSVADEG